MIIMSIATTGILAGLFSCPTHEPTIINVNLISENLQIDNRYTKDQLAKMNKGSISPTHNGDFPLISGLTNSNIKVSTETSFTYTTNSMLKRSCIWAGAIDVNLYYAPVMYISKSYKPSSCRYTETKKHELKHVSVDVDTLKSYNSYIKQTAEIAAKDQADIIVNPEDLESKQKTLSQKIAAAVQVAINKMEENLKVRQRQIDTRAEYEHLSTTCPNETNR